MPKHVLKDVKVTVNAVDLSDHISSVEVMLSKDEVETTAFAGNGGRERIQGLEDDSFTLNFQQDFGTAEVDATLYPLFQSGSPFAVVVTPSTAAVSATNPSYSGTCVLFEYQPLAGAIGDLSETSVTLPVNGIIERATA
ncbi:MAG TPA: hypothetical protein VF377_10505 [Acidimicrobiia bacterium]